ncbi:AAA family ATPase [Nocardia sp. CA-136227]|uniref:AAA family ATPase n=1 Tax=Nocardia sp. CA-136227 TaxID=3239979 RepID=UPI003D990A70
MNDRQAARIAKLQKLIARGRTEDAAALLERDLTLTPEQRKQIEQEISAAGKSLDKGTGVAALANKYGPVDGFRELPQAHLSVRIPWHDTDWTGHVCADPSANHFCTVLKNIKDNKNDDDEVADAGRAWSSLPAKRIPPCVVERGGFMRVDAFDVQRVHAYAGGWTASHAHFAPTAQRMPPYSVEATPYRWTMREHAPLIAEAWGIAYNAELEARADAVLETKRSTAWVQDHRNQAAMLDSFFSALVPGRSLMFLYAKDVPLLEDAPAGTRVLVGVGRVTGVGDLVEWNYSDKGPLRSVMWERSVKHSIRTDSIDGFLLPYQTLLASKSLRGTDLSTFVATVAPEHFEQFSYVSELVDHDAAIAALLELTRVVDLLPGVVDGPWHQAAAWLSERVAEIWEQRGPYPGLGAVLTAAGVARGGLIAYRAVQGLDDSADLWPAVEAEVEQHGRVARKTWAHLTGDEEQFALVRLLARFPLTTAQARRLLERSTGQVLENPYLLYEDDRGLEDAVTFTTIDRGIFNQSSFAAAVFDAYPMTDPVDDPGDDRRIRAACVQVLETAATEGHTLLDEPMLRRRLAALPVSPPCDPPSTLFEIAVRDFPPVLCEHRAQDGSRAWQLQRLSIVSDVIQAEVDARVNSGPLDVEWEWRGEIDRVFDESPSADDIDEHAARSEKATALEVLARSRFSVLVGPAGTGKTTLLRALCTHPDISHRGVLLLAPTGKARVQLGDRAGVQAQTLAQFLRSAQRWDPHLGYRINPDKPKISGYTTVIIDEASMLTEEMLAALFDTLLGAQRLILCGDHRQLPPIGAGRPFVDILSYLRNDRACQSGVGFAELTVSRRQRSVKHGARDDLSVASLFSTDDASPTADEALARVLAGAGDATISIHTWTDRHELRDALDMLLGADPDIALDRRDRDSLLRSLGASGEYNGRPSFVRGMSGDGAENWQLLSPVRAHDGGVHWLNDFIRETYRPGAVRAARNRGLPPLGNDQILRHDKIICIRNHFRQMWQPSTREASKVGVANGEIGIATEVVQHHGLKIEFAARPDAQFTFWESELNSDADNADILELAYAVTVHKSQGSQFGVTFVIVPQPCALLSPELLYTALTRQRHRTVLLLQGTTNDLWALTDPQRSETARRLTRLFHNPDPIPTHHGSYLDGGRIHRTAAGELVRSKSEVIVANTLRHLGIQYKYEQPLVMADGTRRLPDFTIHRSNAVPTYWEHLGMLASPGYRADWEAKKAWYRAHQILPFDEGGGKNGTLVWSDEEVRNPGIAADYIESLARRVLF